jgi:hypothetical protein
VQRGLHHFPKKLFPYSDEKICLGPGKQWEDTGKEKVNGKSAKISMTID